MVMKSQGQMLEYVLMMVFIVAVVLGLIFFLTWWQISQLSVEQSRNQQDRALSLLKQLSNSPYLAKEDSVLDDAKLTVMSGMIPDACSRLQKIYGTDWNAEVRLFDDKPLKPCTQSTYPDGNEDCNYYTFCPVLPTKTRITRVIPVNIYRNIGYLTDTTNATISRTFIGTLNVTVYV
jgi:hypothetical protein